MSTFEILGTASREASPTEADGVPSTDPATDATTCRLLARRGLLGSVMYLLIWVLVAEVAGFSREWPTLSNLGVWAFTALAIPRAILALGFTGVHGRSPQRWLMAYSTVVVLTAATWGALSFAVIRLVQPPDPTPFLVGTAIAGLAAGGMAGLLTHLRLQRSHVLLTVVPGAVACGLSGHPQLGVMAILLVIGGAYILVIGWQLNAQHLASFRANVELGQQARTDSLTGLPNRREFDARLELEWQRACRNGSDMTLVLLDIDHFKEFNDSFGHGAGDACLRRVGKTLASCFRRATELPARYGGEEFALIVTEQDTEELPYRLQALADRMRALHVPNAHAVTESRITVSVGAATLRPGPADSPTRAMKRVDQLLYLAKSEGRNRVIQVDERRPRHESTDELDLEPAPAAGT